MRKPAPAWKDLKEKQNKKDGKIIEIIEEFRTQLS